MSHISEIGLVALFWRTGHLQPEMIPNDATSDRCYAQSMEKYHILSPFWSNILMFCIWLDHSLCSWLLVTERVHSAQTAKLFLHTLFVRTVQFLRSCPAHVCLCCLTLFITLRLPRAYPATCYVVSKKGVDRIVVDGTSLWDGDDARGALNLQQTPPYYPKLPLLARKQLASNAQRKTHTVPNADTTRRLTRYPPPVPCWGAGWRHVLCGWQCSHWMKNGSGRDSERVYICVSFQENLDSFLKDGRTSCVIGLKGFGNEWFGVALWVSLRRMVESILIAGCDI